MLVTNFILGIQKINDKHYKRDILIKTVVGDTSFDSAQYVTLEETLKYFNISNVKLENNVVRGFNQYARGGENYDRLYKDDLLKKLHFKQLLNKGTNLYNIGYSIIFKKNAFAYKQPILKNGDFNYYLLRINFKSDDQYVEFKGSHLSNVYTNKDININKDKLYSKIQNQTLNIVQDTIYLYSVYDRIKLELNDSEYNKYFTKNTIYDERENYNEPY